MSYFISFLLYSVNNANIVCKPFGHLLLIDVRGSVVHRIVFTCSTDLLNHFHSEVTIKVELPTVTVIIFPPPLK